jgi:hypothetical protein
VQAVSYVRQRFFISCHGYEGFFLAAECRWGHKR